MKRAIIFLFAVMAMFVVLLGSALLAEPDRRIEGMTYAGDTDEVINGLREKGHALAWTEICLPENAVTDRGNGAYDFYIVERPCNFGGEKKTAQSTPAFISKLTDSAGVEQGVAIAVPTAEKKHRYFVKETPKEAPKPTPEPTIEQKSPATTSEKKKEVGENEVGTDALRDLALIQLSHRPDLDEILKDAKAEDGVVVFIAGKKTVVGVKTERGVKFLDPFNYETPPQPKYYFSKEEVEKEVKKSKEEVEKLWLTRLVQGIAAQKIVDVNFSFTEQRINNAGLEVGSTTKIIGGKLVGISPCQPQAEDCQTTVQVQDKRTIYPAVPVCNIQQAFSKKHGKEAALVNEWKSKVCSQ